MNLRYSVLRDLSEVREARLNVLFEIELMSNGVVQLLSDLLVEGELSV
jgi:hypothetical protein